MSLAGIAFTMLALLALLPLVGTGIVALAVAVRDHRKHRAARAVADAHRYETLAARLRDIERETHEAERRAWQAEYDALCEATEREAAGARTAIPATCESGHHVWALCRADCILCGTWRERGAA